MTHFVVFSMEILRKIASRSVVFNFVMKEGEPPPPTAERRLNCVFHLIRGGSLPLGVIR